MPDILDHGPFVTRQQRGSERRAASAIRSLPAHAAALPGAMSSTSDEHQRNETNDNLNRGKIFYTKMVMSDDRQLKPLTSFSFVVGDNTASNGSRHNFNIPPLSENVQWWPRDLLPQTMDTLQSKTSQDSTAISGNSSCPATWSEICGRCRCNHIIACPATVVSNLSGLVS